MAKTSKPKLYTRTSPTGVGFETASGGFFVKTMFRESAVERARQEFASGRDVVSAAIYEDGKLWRILDWRDFAANQTTDEGN